MRVILLVLQVVAVAAGGWLGTIVREAVS